MCVCVALTDQRECARSWRHTKSPHRNPHTSCSSHTRKNSLSLSLCHFHFPLSSSHFYAIKNCAKLSASLADSHFFHSYSVCACVCVFFFRAKDFACGYNMDMSHAHRSHRPIAVIVGQSYCHISGLITTAICGRQACRLRRQAGQKSFSWIFRFSLTEKMPKSNRKKLSKKFRLQ